MSRIIINNHSRVSDFKALELVQSVVKEGRISNNDTQYCYCTRIQYPSTGEVFYVSASRTKSGTDSFDIRLEAVLGGKQ